MKPFVYTYVYCLISLSTNIYYMSTICRLIVRKLFCSICALVAYQCSYLFVCILDAASSLFVHLMLSHGRSHYVFSSEQTRTVMHVVAVYALRWYTHGCSFASSSCCAVWKHWEGRYCYLAATGVHWSCLVQLLCRSEALVRVRFCCNIMGRRRGRYIRAATYQLKVSIDALPQESFAELCNAFNSFYEQVEDMFPKRTKRSRSGKLAVEPAFGKKVHKQKQNRITYLQRRVRKLSEELSVMKHGKRDLNGKRSGTTSRLTPEFIAKVALAIPGTNARSFAASWQDLVGVGVAGCSRPQISRIRDAFVEVVKDMVSSDISKAAAASQVLLDSQISAAAAPDCSATWSPAILDCAPQLHSVALLHIHDEAFLRLRSTLDVGMSGVSRSRSSKVQQHVTSVHFADQLPISWYVDLDALSSKTAKVLAHSLMRVLCSLFDVVLDPMLSDRPDQEAWFFMCW